MSKGRKPQKQARKLLPSALGGAGVLFSAVVGWIAYSAVGIQHDLSLPKSLDAERKNFRSQGCAVSYYVKGDGPPLVLLHAINAAGCAYEVKPLFEYYAARRKVYALEWPGFGFSERADRAYSPINYVTTLIDFMTEVVKQPADVLALSLACEFAARAATLRPERFRRLVLISPSGFDARRTVEDRVYQDRGNDLALRVFQNPIWSQAFYDLIASKPSIRYYLSIAFNGPVESGLEQYGYATSHQPGARYAPLYFIAGKLFSRDIQHIYASVQQPVLMIYGDDDPFVTYERAEHLRHKPNWTILSYRGRAGLMHFDNLQELTARLDTLWKAPDLETSGLQSMRQP